MAKGKRRSVRIEVSLKVTKDVASLAISVFQGILLAVFIGFRIGPQTNCFIVSWTASFKADVESEHHFSQVKLVLFGCLLGFAASIYQDHSAWSNFSPGTATFKSAV